MTTTERATAPGGSLAVAPARRGAASLAPVARPSASLAPRAKSTGRPAAAVRRPVHLAVMAGAAAGLYAASLAGVTALQAGSDAALARERDPIADAILGQRAQHDRLETAIASAAAGYAEAAAAYASILEALGGHEAELAALERAVAAAEGTAARLAVPARPALPNVRSTVSTRTARPPTNASTGASGGG